jgi:hypothetical protein
LRIGVPKEQARAHNGDATKLAAPTRPDANEEEKRLAATTRRRDPPPRENKDRIEEMTKNYHISAKGVGLLPLLVFVTHKYQFCGSAATDCPDLLVLVL